MKVGGYGEDRLVAELAGSPAAARDVIAGVGDDCAIIGRPRDRVWQLLKTDAVVESIHFHRGTPPAKVGWKAMARPVSDFAAMAGRPRFALVTICIERSTLVSYVKGIYRGLRRAAACFGVTIVGGETSRSPGPLMISVALSGTVERRRCIRRSGGKPGDFLYVTGKLGGSLNGRHLAFEPRLAEARWLAANFPIHAMMDLSDGLAADLPRLAKASRTGYELRAEDVPRNPRCSTKRAIGDGEDYELLFAVGPKESARLERAWKAKWPSLKLTRIGTLTSARKTPQSPAHGYDHFAKSR